MRKSRVGLLVSTALIIVLLMVMAGCATEETTVDGIPVGPYKGKLAADFTLNTIDGDQVTLSDLRGKPVLLIFWATWCSECRQELEYWKTAYADYEDQGLMILAIDVGESQSEVRDFVNEREINVTVLLDSDRDVAKSYYVGNFPRNFFIDRDGFIQLVVMGRFKYDADWDIQLRKIL